MRTKAAVGVVLLLLWLTGCAAVFAILAQVVAAVQIAEQAVAAVQSYADSHVADQALREKIDAAATTARATLAAAVHAAKGGGDLAKRDVKTAFDEFGRAYQALLDLVPQGLGLQVQDSPKLSARPGGLVVPSAKALRAEMER